MSPHHGYGDLLLLSSFQVTAETSTTIVTEVRAILACNVRDPMVINGGFEDGVAPWRLGLNTPEDDVFLFRQSYTGDYSLSINCDANASVLNGPPLVRQLTTLCQWHF